MGVESSLYTAVELGLVLATEVNAVDLGRHGLRQNVREVCADVLLGAVERDAVHDGLGVALVDRGVRVKQAHKGREVVDGVDHGGSREEPLDACRDVLEYQVPLALVVAHDVCLIQDQTARTNGLEDVTVVDEFVVVGEVDTATECRAALAHPRVLLQLVDGEVGVE